MARHLSSIILFSAFCILYGCGQGTYKPVDVRITNPTAEDRSGEMVELPARSLRSEIGSRHLFVVDSKGNEIPSQVTHDSLLIFKANVSAGKTVRYKVCGSDTLHHYRKVVGGRIYPERSEDLAWENETGGYRVYGPPTRLRGEPLYGNDVFFKYPTQELILDKLYAPQTDPLTAAWIDSIRHTNSSDADSYYQSVSYHVDHGLGMDCYFVGPTLGAGGNAIARGDSLIYSWCYDYAEVIDNGPLRFTAHLVFCHYDLVPGKSILENRLVTLDSGSKLNRCQIWYDGQTGPMTIVTGFPLRDDQPARSDIQAHWLVYSDPTQGAGNGRALLAVVHPQKKCIFTEIEGHIVASANIEQGDTLTYYWGASWMPVQTADTDTWIRQTDQTARRLASPLRIKAGSAEFANGTRF